MEGCAVTDGGGDGDDGDGDHPADDAGECTLHPSAGDDDIGFMQQWALSEQAMNASDADVGDASHGGAEKLGGNGGLIGNGEVTAAGADDGNFAFRAEGALAEGDAGWEYMVLSSGAKLLDGLVGGLTRFGGEDIDPAGGEAREDGGDLLGRFAESEDDLWHTGAQSAMVVNLGEADVFKGEIFKARGSVVGSEFAGLNALEQMEELVFMHGGQSFGTEMRWG